MDAWWEQTCPGKGLVRGAGPPPRAAWLQQDVVDSVVQYVSSAPATRFQDDQRYVLRPNGCGGSRSPGQQGR